jgi:hypothetical protein
MRAEILHRSDLALRAAIEHDLLAADGAAQWLAVDFIRRARYVPGVGNIFVSL